MTDLPRPRVNVPLNIADGLAVSTYRTPNKVAVFQGEKRLTFRQLNERANRVGNALRGLGLQPGDRIGVVLANIPEYIEICFGLSRAGFVIVPISYRLIGPEIAYHLNDSGAVACIFADEYDGAIEAARSEAREVCHWIRLGTQPVTGCWDYEDFLAQASAADTSFPVEETTPFCIYYTSGTTGLPKGAVVSHRSRALTFFGMAAEYGCYSADDIGLGTAPIYHGAGMAFSLATVYFGGTLSVMKQFRPEEMLQRIATEGVTNAFMVPTMFHAIFGLPEGIRRQYDLSHFRVWMSNAAALPQATKELILAEWPHTRLFELYGSTEGGIVTSLRPEDQLRKIQCVGHPFPLTDVKLLDDEGNEVPPNTVGELFSRSPYLFNGYYNRPRETEEGFRGEYFSAGDLALRDDEGYIYIVDRKKDMVVSGGVNIYPREIEEVLFRHPKIADVAVIGVPDPYWGEALKAVVVLKPGETATEEELLAFTEGKLARFKQPKSVAFLNELPRNAAQKVLKRQLREMFKQ
ncbi:MAG: fatty-acid--CoA ligase [Dehalococcoidia bacterium]|nr:MAG: fatty-acid--CoA ligase [Dehalococcoidia bacterium]